MVTFYHQGNYSGALNLIAYAKKQFPANTQHSDIWCLQEQQLLFTRAVRQGRWSATEAAVNNMAAVSKQEATYWSVGKLRHTIYWPSDSDLLSCILYAFILWWPLNVMKSVGKCGCDFKCVNFKHNLGHGVDIFSSNKNQPWNDGEPTLVQVMAWCHHATSH